MNAAVDYNPYGARLVNSDVDVAELATLIADVHRSRPVVVIGARSHDGRSVDALIARVVPRADVRMIGGRNTTRKLSARLRTHGIPTPDEQHVRVYARHFGTLRTSPSDHPVITLGRVNEQEQLIEAVAAAAHDPNSEREQQIHFDIPTPGPRLVAVPEPVAAAEPDQPSTPVEPEGVRRIAVPFPEGIHVIAQLSDAVADQAAQLGCMRQQAERLEAELRTEIARTNSLRRDNDRLRAQKTKVSADGATPNGDDSPARPTYYCDPEKQLRLEIELAWLETVAEGERGEWPLRDYSFGPDFIDSLDTVGCSRNKAIVVAVQVITRRACAVSAREVRQFTETGMPGSPQRTRADGASAWRANVANNTAQAARFLWWELADGTVELGKASMHDDMELR